MAFGRRVMKGLAGSLSAAGPALMQLEQSKRQQAALAQQQEENKLTQAIKMLAMREQYGAVPSGSQEATSMAGPRFEAPAQPRSPSSPFALGSAMSLGGSAPKMREIPTEVAPGFMKVAPDANERRAAAIARLQLPKGQQEMLSALADIDPNSAGTYAAQMAKPAPTPSGYTVQGRDFGDDLEGAANASKAFADAGRAPTVAPMVVPKPNPNADEIADAGAARLSLDNFGALTAEFMALSPAKRTAAVAGLGHQDLVGRIESASSATLLEVKALAKLGVLSEQDTKIVTDLIGDPLDGRSLMRSPKYVTAKLAEAQAFLDRKLGALGGGNAPARPLDSGGTDLASLKSKYGLD